MKRLLIAAIAGLLSVSAHAQFDDSVLFEPPLMPPIHDGIEYIGDQGSGQTIVAIRGLQVDDKVYDVRFEYGTFNEFDAQGKMPLYRTNDIFLGGKVLTAIFRVLDSWSAYSMGNPRRSRFEFVLSAVRLKGETCGNLLGGIVCTWETQSDTGPREPDFISWGGRRELQRSKDFTTLYATLELIAVTTTVAIDIKPYSDNKVNLANLKINVAVLTTDDFDASTVDLGTVRFGPGEALPVYYRYKDTDGDGDLDLLMRFLTADTDIACGDTSATLTGQTFDGTAIEGTVLDIYTRDSRKDGVKCQP